MTLSNLFKCTIESDSAWLHLMVGTLNQLVSLKGKESGDPTVPASSISSGTTGKVRPKLLACLAPARISRELPNHESRALPRAHARQGKETVQLVGNRSDLVGRHDRHRRYWWS